MANQNLSSEQFVSLYHRSGKYLHQVAAYDQDGNIIGTLDWNRRSKRVYNVAVAPKHQRQGVASHMWDYAHHVASERGEAGPKHSPDRSAEGDAWAKSVGGDLPPNRMKNG